MQYEKHTLVLESGEELHVGLNANTYVSDTQIDESVLSAACAGYVIDRTDDSGEETKVENIYKIEQRKCDDGWQLCLFVKSKEMLEAESVQEQLNELILMMADMIGG